MQYIFNVFHVVASPSCCMLLICQHFQVQSRSQVCLSVLQTSITGNVYIHVCGWNLQEDTAAGLMEQN